MRSGRLNVLLLLVLALTPVPGLAQELGTDITGLNLCLYGDCEARGSYAADPYGWVNPATIPVGTLPYVARGGFFSGSYFRLESGEIAGDIGSGTLTLAWDPVLVQVNAVYAEADGPLAQAPLDLDFRTSVVRLAAALDLDRTAWRVPGLCLGLTAGLPLTDSDLRLSAGGFEVAHAREERRVDLTLGAHWRGGARQWFMAGAFVNALRNPLTIDSLDPTTGESVRTAGDTNAWFARVGLSLLPAVGLGLAEGTNLGAEWLGDLRLGTDVAYANISVPGEDSRSRTTGYFGFDARILPDAWNPLADYVRFYVISGVDTAGGWGAGLGLYGSGPLQFLSCNPSYSSRPLAPSLGPAVDLWSATCSVSIPL